MSETSGGAGKEYVPDPKKDRAPEPPMSAREQRVILACAYMISASAAMTRGHIMACIMGIPEEGRAEMVERLSEAAVAETNNLFVNACKVVDNAVERAEVMRAVQARDEERKRKGEVN